LIHAHTEGLPRRVSILCHNVLEYLVMYDKRYADRNTVQLVIERESASDDFKNVISDQVRPLQPADVISGSTGGFLRVVNA
jgi:hypothetical protein